MKNISKISFYNLVLTYITLVLGFGITITQAKVITAEEIGVLSIILVLSQTIGSAVLFGVPAAIIRFYKEQSSASGRTAFIAISFLFPIVLFLVSCFILFFAADEITEIYKNDYLNKYFHYIYFFLFASVVGKLFRVLFEVEQKPLLANILYDTVVFSLHILFLFLMFVIHIEFHYYLIFNIFILFVRVLLFLFYFFRSIKLSKPDFTCFSGKTNSYVTYCLFMFFSSMAGTLTSSIDKLMLGFYMDLKAVGVYTIISALTAVIIMIGGAFSRITHPLIAVYWQKQENSKIGELYNENANTQLFFGLFAFMLFAIFSKEVTGFLGDEYTEGYLALIILCFGQIVSIGTGICGGIISLSKYYKFDLYTRGFLVLLTVVTNMMLIPIWGLNGAAAATAISLVLYNVAKVIFVYYKFRMQPYNMQTIKIITLALIVSSLVYLAQMIFNLSGIFNIAVCSALFFILYVFVAVYIFRIKEVKNLLRQICKEES
jgi:O-antigen/teichoic acid export membrane protein